MIKDAFCKREWKNSTHFFTFFPLVRIWPTIEAWLVLVWGPVLVIWGLPSLHLHLPKNFYTIQYDGLNLKNGYKILLSETCSFQLNIWFVKIINYLIILKTSKFCVIWNNLTSTYMMRCAIFINRLLPFSRCLPRSCYSKLNKKFYFAL